MNSNKVVPVCVMLPLDLITLQGLFLDITERTVWKQLLKLKEAKVEAVMIDLWWGIVEQEQPG